jgi:hypothetical protein
MTPCSLTILFIPTLVGVALFSVIPSHQPVQPCAETCSCTAEDTDWGSAVNVQCGDRNLIGVPITLNDKPVSVLNVSFNVLKAIAEDALLSYESVRYLYLQYCKIFNINEKAFQILENLTVIDLSSNRLTSISPNLFSGNQKLDKLILQSNELRTLQLNTTILNGPSSLSFLDLQSCYLSNISSKTFSSLRNLTSLDISRNNLNFLDPDTLSSHEKLKDVNLENNPWMCGPVFERLMCWIHSKLPRSHSRTVKCRTSPSEMWDIWSPENISLFCDSDSTPSFTSSHTTGISTGTKRNTASTQSHEVNKPTNTTLNHEVPLIEQIVTDSASLCLWVLLVVSLFVVVVVVVVLLRYNQCCKDIRRLFLSVIYQPVPPENVAT